jgi:hypothetical protein
MTPTERLTADWIADLLIGATAVACIYASLWSGWWALELLAGLAD